MKGLEDSEKLELDLKLKYHVCWIGIEDKMLVALGKERFLRLGNFFSVLPLISDIPFWFL